MSSTQDDMSTSKQKGETKQLRWSTTMDQFMLDLLVDEANQGNKVDKTCKDCSFTRAAKEVSERFQLVCTPDNVRNRMKTIKKNFKEVKQIESNNSGMSWDDNLKMWKCSDDVYKEFIRAHPGAEKYLNKPISMYNELCIVCGDDQATGFFAKSSADAFENDETLDIIIDDITTNNIQMGTNSLKNPYVRKHGKRVRPMDGLYAKIGDLANAVVDMANTLKKSKSQDRTADLYDEVMKTEGFDEITLEAFYYLNENEKKARAFLVMNPAGRGRWLAKFIPDLNE